MKRLLACLILLFTIGCEKTIREVSAPADDRQSAHAMALAR